MARGPRKRKVDLPGPRMPAIVQSLAFAARPIAFVRAMRRRYGPNFRLDIPPFGEGAYLSDPEAIKQVFTGGDAYHAGEANWVLRPILGDRSVLVLDGGEHLKQRRMLLPPFHGDAVRRYADTVRDATEDEVAGWPSRRPFPARPAMQRITLEVIMRAVIGARDEERLAELRSLLTRLLDIRMHDVTLFSVWPSVGQTRIGRRMPPYSHRARVAAVLDEEIAERRTGRTGDDILSLLVAARDPDGHAMTDEEIRDEIITLLVAGHETTATGLAWALERLSRHPAALRRLYDEVDAGESDDYAEAVCRETLRVRPVIQDVLRVVQHPVDVGGGRIEPRVVQQPVEVGGGRIEPGALALPAIALVQLDGDVYDDPDEFRPERFLDTKPGTYTWIPFGGGTRRCVGAAFAVMEMKIALATILRHVDLATTRAPGERARIRHVTLVPHRDARIAVAGRRHPAAATVPPHGRPQRLARGHPRPEQQARTGGSRRAHSQAGQRGPAADAAHAPLEP